MMTTWELGRLESSSPARKPSVASDVLSRNSSTRSLVTTHRPGDSTSSTSFSDDNASRQIPFKSTPAQPPPHQSPPPYVQKISKAFGLSAGINLLAKAFGWPVTERKKIVMNKDRLLASLRCVVHLVPISAAIALLFLNGSNHYIGGELAGATGQDNQKLAALLFASKLHELFMLASLSAVVITYIRKELVYGNGVPFGTVFSATQYKDLTFLWSPELWGTILHEWEKRRKKWFTICLLLVCSLLGLTVGPSTGILMRPRLDAWPAGGTTFWINATEALLNPKTMEISADLAHCAVDKGDPSCPAAGWRVFNEQYFPYWKSLGGMGAIPQTLYISGRSSLRQIVLRTRNIYGPSSLLWANAFTLASVPPSIVADALVDLERYWINAAVNTDIGNFKYRRDVTFATETLQPLVLTRCDGPRVPSDAENLFFPNFRNVTLSDGPGSAAGHASSAIFEGNFQPNDTNVTSQIERLLTSDHPSLYWIDDAHYLQETNSSLTVVATVPKSNAGAAAYYTCVIDSRLANVTLNTSRNSITYVLGAPNGYDTHGTFNQSYRPVKPSAEWAGLLNPMVTTSNKTNATVFSTLAETAGLWTSNPTTDPVWFPIIVENILATLVANGIGRANFNRTMSGNLTGQDDPSDPWSLGKWMQQILPRNGRLGYGGNAFNISKHDENISTKFVLKVQILGYAYSPKGITQIAAMVVLSVYVVLVLCHIGYTTATGWSSGSWGSPSELTALAMNSTPTSKLKNTGGGIETIEVFKEMVKVRLKDERAQIMFNDTRGGRELETGVAYA